jgi:hypothetical protein
MKKTATPLTLRNTDEARERWSRVIWSPPAGRVAPICSACSGPLPEVPVQLWAVSGSTAHFCDACSELLFELVK